ncbi:hypothetical protein BGZ65_005065 [Modicella reniformis]|uniref:Ubiquitin-like protease family profile domain-containing protein n=1 Tax=Modicella reniformis TaxID=1440133 RepID=A0A9P6M2M1_9FUNG|nr:hypothetical protein BGZ65_005065 [Modicella reniformis]
MPTDSENHRPRNNSPSQPKLEERIAMPTVTLLPNRQKPSTFEHSSLSNKASALGMGTFPQANLTSVRLGQTELKKPEMVIQFGPDRFIINIDKNVTKISHDSLKRIEYNVDGGVKILIIQTKRPLPSTSVLESHDDPTPNAGKAKKITLLMESDAQMIVDCCKRIKKLNIEVKPLSSEAANNILSKDFQSPAPSDASNSSTKSEGTTPSTGDSNQADDTLFQFPFKSSARSKSISVRVADMFRLNEGEFLNDTLIEFGLKYVHANLESTDPELAEKIYIFNSFFYERLIANAGRGISYDGVKSWTNKIDLFSKKFIIIPIHENLHWFLAIIANPGLLLSSADGSSSGPSSTRDNSCEPEGRSPTPPSNDASGESSGDSLSSRLSPHSDEAEQECGDNAKANKRVLRSSARDTEAEAKAKPYILDVLGKLAKCPQQENFCDCGLFVLHYAEMFLKHPGPLLDGIVVWSNKKDDLDDYWAVEELALKREKYQEIMTSLAEQYKAYLSSAEQINQTKRRAARH